MAHLSTHAPGSLCARLDSKPITSFVSDQDRPLKPPEGVDLGCWVTQQGW